MKIEKVNDHQIRCTLTGADLANRELKISELAYGSEKAKNLFRDMMQQASFEFGFEAEDIPLMIEAIPVNADCIVLIITKVEDPDEIDTRFSKFSPSLSAEDDAAEDDITDHFSDDVLDLFQKIKNSAGAVSNTQNEEPQTAAPRMLQAGLNHLCTFSRIVKDAYTAESALYKDPEAMQYCLVLTMGDMSQQQFGKICNIASEYGSVQKVEPARSAYLQEHYEVLVPQDAVSALAQIQIDCKYLFYCNLSYLA